MTSQVGDRVTGPWKGSWPLSATRVYPSGGVHNAWDVACPVGTALYAARDGTIGARNAGVPNNSPGHNPGSGAPSNYVVLWTRDDSGDRAYLYYQHMSPNGVIGKGKVVKAGDLIGYSGNSGNSSGPHLHVAAGTDWPTAAQRYAYLTSPSRLIYPPSKLFGDDMALSQEDIDKVSTATAKKVWATMMESLRPELLGKEYTAERFIQAINRDVAPKP